jgi:uncharacterized membrane protein YjfL (UPF0719 family)
MMSPTVRKIGWFLIGDLAFIAFLFVLGRVLNTMKIRRGSNFITDMLGPHGLVFGAVVPLAVYLLVLAAIVWIIAWATSSLRK